jgi:hypothetical protein
MPFSVSVLPSFLFTKSNNPPMTDFAQKTLDPTISMLFKFQKKLINKCEGSDVRQCWSYEIFDGAKLVAVMHASVHFLNATIIIGGKTFEISPVINYFTLNKYLVLENDLDIGELTIPSLLHKKLLIEIYDEGLWEIRRSQARSKTVDGIALLETPTECGNASPLKKALLLFLTELLAWESNRL